MDRAESDQLRRKNDSRERRRKPRPARIILCVLQTAGLKVTLSQLEEWKISSRLSLKTLLHFKTLGDAESGLRRSLNCGGASTSMEERLPAGE